MSTLYVFEKIVPSFTLQCLFMFCRLLGMRLHRFCVSQPLGEEVVIEDVSLVHQWTNVFRYRQGDFVILFNGNGHDYRYLLKEITKTSCYLALVETTSSYIPSQKISLCLSIIKKDNFELATQKATELGVTSIIPILSSRSEKKNLSLDRLKKIVIEASEQCGRGDIPFISPIITLEEALASITPHQHGVVLNMGGTSFATAKNDIKNKETVLFVGPEGGWSDEDLLLIRKRGVQEYSLGESVLRAETAAIAASTLLIL